MPLRSVASASYRWPDGHGMAISSLPLRPPHRLRQRAASLVLATCLVVGLMLSLGLLTAPARAAAPATPGSFAVGTVTSSSAALSWTASPGAIGYRVYRGPASAADSALTLITTTDAPVVKYTVANLRSGTAYKFAIAALSLDNQTSPLAVKPATTLTSTDTTAPAAPSIGSVLLTAFSSSRVDVIWGASTSTDVAYYEVLRGGVVVGTVERPAATKFSHNGLTAATTYSYSVQSVDSAGNKSAATTAKSVKTLASGAIKIVRGPYAVRVDSTSAVVSWWTNLPTTGSVAVTGGPTASDPAQGLQHKVTLTGLAAGTEYPYTVTSGSVSAAGRLRTAAKPGQPFTFAVIGDFGAGSTPEAQNAAQIGSFNSDFLQTVGDNLYPSSGMPDPNPATQYSDIDGRILKQFGGVFKKQAFFPANGNHEYYGNGQFWTAFPMPGTNNWYSYDWGDAHILVLDSMQPYTTTSAQYAFAKADLASPAAKKAKWQIVILPNPPYNTSTSEMGGSAGTRTTLVPLFEQNGVDVVLSGDAHNYQRTKPLIGGAAATSGGVTYIVSGGGGNGLNSFTGTMPTWQAFRQAAFQSLKVDVSATALTVSAIAASGGAVIDSVTLGTPAPSDTTAPTVPTGLTATPAGTSVALSWTASTDNVGVDHYNVYRDGAATPLTSVTGTSYTDSGLTAGTTYNYQVSAVDAAGNDSGTTAMVPATTTPAPTGGTTVQATLLADRTIDPASTTPTSTRLKVDASAPVNDLLVKFDVPTTCSVTAAHLKLTVGSGSTDPSTKGGDFYATSPTDPNAAWDEASVVWATAPAKSTTTPPVTLAGAVALNTTYDIDVTSLVPTKGGTFTIRGSSTSADGAGYLSKEGSATLGPRLDVTCS
jgi:chitodextrinase